MFIDEDYPFVETRQMIGRLYAGFKQVELFDIATNPLCPIETRRKGAKEIGKGIAKQEMDNICRHISAIPEEQIVYRDFDSEIVGLMPTKIQTVVKRLNST